MPTFGELRTEEEQAVDRAVLDRVLRGIELLEEMHGPAWVDKVNLDTLELGSCRMCVLGQVYGDYSVGLRALRKTRGCDYGFDKIDRSSFTGWAELNRAWRIALRPMKERRERAHVR